MGKKIVFHFKKAALVNNWFIKNKISFTVLNRLALSNILVKKIPSDILSALSSIGKQKSNISYICLNNVFTIDNPYLAYIVHESLSTDRCGIKDKLKRCLCDPKTFTTSLSHTGTFIVLNTC